MSRSAPFAPRVGHPFGTGQVQFSVFSWQLCNSLIRLLHPPERHWNVGHFMPHCTPSSVSQFSVGSCRNTQATAQSRDAAAAISFAVTFAKAMVPKRSYGYWKNSFGGCKNGFGGSTRRRSPPSLKLRRAKKNGVGGNKGLTEKWG